MGGLVDRIDADDLPERLVAALSTLAPFGMAVFFVNRGRSRPICLHDTFPDEKAKSGVRNYVNGTYVLNPAYLAHLGGVETGIYRMCDLAPDGFFHRDFADIDKISRAPSEEIGFITQGWPTGLEELVIFVRLGSRTTAEIDLFCPRADNAFDDRVIARLQAQLPVVASIVRKHWSLCGQALAENPVDARIDELFDGFGKPELSDREHEVVQHILRGHSSESIGYNLKISITTVKTHRKRAYAKLNVSSQSELLSLFLQTVAPHLVSK